VVQGFTTHASYFISTGFETQSPNRLYRQKNAMTFLIPSSQVLEYNVTIGQSSFYSESFHFIIHVYLTVIKHITPVIEIALLNE